MKTVRFFNYHNDGNDSRVNVYFADGTEWHRTINSQEVQKLAHEGESYLPTLLDKYYQPQQKTERLKMYGRKVFF